MMLRVSRHVKGTLPIFLSTVSTVVHSSGIGRIDAASETASAKMTSLSCWDDEYGRISSRTGCFPNRSGVGIASATLAILASVGSRVDALARASQDTY
jgi:hypothetical protein